MKKIIAIFAVLLLSLSVFVGCVNSADAQVVATVNDETITGGEMKYAIEMVKAQSIGQLSAEDAEEFWKTEKDGKNAEDYIRDKALELLVDLAVQAQAAKDNGIGISGSEVDTYFKKNQESMQQVMDTYQLSEATMKAILRKQMLSSKYGERIMADDPRFSPSEEDLKRVFSEKFLKAQHILKLTKDQTTQALLPQEEIDAKKAEAEKLLAQAKGGADFTALMTANSEDPGSIQQPEGYVFTEGEMVTEFYEGALALEENGISDIVESSYGYHIIKRLPLDVEADFQTNIEKVQSAYSQVAAEELIAELKAGMTVTPDDAKLKAIPVRTEETAE